VYGVLIPISDLFGRKDFHGAYFSIIYNLF
jgi:hypothetical protein